MSRPIFCNGIEGIGAGEPMFVPSIEEIAARAIRADSTKDEHTEELATRFRNDQLAKKDKAGLLDGLDPRNLAEAGWGVVFGPGTEKAKAKLRSLLVWRKQLAGPLYREIDYAPGTTKSQFTKQNGAGGGGLVDPKNGLPYYLVLVGDPEAIGFGFQYELDVQYAVGRLYFDNDDDYEVYANNVVKAEQEKLARPRKAVFFATANDDVTRSSADDLIAPMAQFAGDLKVKWDVEHIDPDGAFKADLTAVFAQAPAFLMTATHGMGYPLRHLDQRSHTGALVCQDWPGPRRTGSLETTKFDPNWIFTADDLHDDANVYGTIALFFACFGAGCPRMNEFPKPSDTPQRAEKAFISRLPQRLLAHPKGSALAVIGHVEQAWSTSYFAGRSGRQLQSFQSAIIRLLELNYPVGAAMEPFNSRYAESATAITEQIDEINKRFADPDPATVDIDNQILADHWTASRDARNYIVFGDPAVRLMVALPEAPAAAALAVPEPARGAFEVATYLSKDPIRLENGEFPGAVLAALSVVHADGSVRTSLQDSAGDAVLRFHAEALAAALANRPATPVGEGN